MAYLVISADADDIKTHAAGIPEIIFRQESFGNADDPFLLHGRDGIFGPAEILGPARFDLHEDNSVLISGDDIDLPAVKTVIRGKDTVSLLAEITAGQFLASVSRLFLF